MTASAGPDIPADEPLLQDKERPSAHSHSKSDLISEAHAVEDGSQVFRRVRRGGSCRIEEAQARKGAVMPAAMEGRQQECSVPA